MDIVIWLRSLGLEQYEAAFRENAIDISVSVVAGAGNSVAIDPAHILSMPTGRRITHRIETDVNALAEAEAERAMAKKIRTNGRACEEHCLRNQRQVSKR
jgi:hypothetical protein